MKYQGNSLYEFLFMYRKNKGISDAEFEQEVGTSIHNPDLQVIAEFLTDRSTHIDVPTLSALNSANVKMRKSANNLVRKCIIYKLSKGKDLIDLINLYLQVNQLTIGDLQMDISTRTLRYHMDRSYDSPPNVATLQAIADYFSAPDLVLDASMVLGLSSRNADIRRVSNNFFISALIRKSWDV